MAAAIQRIFLVGPMGAGKTTIGRQLARARGWEFVDTDQEIEDRTGADIPWIFDLEGEAGFRQREREALDELTQRTGIVLATGGGVVLAEENRQCLTSRGYVVYLQASVKQLLARTARDRRRPLLQTPDPRAKLEELLAQRGPLYEEVADWVVSTEGRGVRSVVNEIMRKIRPTDDT